MVSTVLRAQESNLLTKSGTIWLPASKGQLFTGNNSQKPFYFIPCFGGGGDGGGDGEEEEDEKEEISVSNQTGVTKTKFAFFSETTIKQDKTYKMMSVIWA